MRQFIREFLIKASPMDLFAMLGSILVAAGTVLTWVFWFGGALAQASAADVALVRELDSVTKRVESLEEKRDRDIAATKEELANMNDNIIRLMIAQGVQPAERKKK